MFWHKKNIYNNLFIYFIDDCVKYVGLNIGNMYLPIRNPQEIAQK